MPEENCQKREYRLAGIMLCQVHSGLRKDIEEGKRFAGGVSFDEVTRAIGGDVKRTRSC